MIEKAARASLLLIFAVFALEDHRNRKISLAMILTGIAAGFGSRMAGGKMDISDIVLSLVPAAMIALISFAGAGAAGCADACMAAVTGLFLGWHQNMVLIAVSFLICAAFSILLICLRRIKWQDSLPFAPFMLAGLVALEAAKVISYSQAGT